MKYDINDNLQNKRKKRIKPNNLLTERDLLPGLFSISIKIISKPLISPQNLPISHQNLPISHQNHFLPDIHVGNISYRYPNYITYSIFNYHLCLIRHYRLLLMPHRALLVLTYALYGIFNYQLCLIRHKQLFLKYHLCRMRH